MGGEVGGDDGGDDGGVDGGVGSRDASILLNGMVRGCRIVRERQKEPVLPKN